MSTQMTTRARPTPLALHPSAGRVDPRVAPLEAEVRRLHAEGDRLRAENDRLRAELARHGWEGPQPPPNVGLTARERQVLELIARGRSTREVADELYIGVNSVKTHTARIFRKLGVSTRTEAAIWVVRGGDPRPGPPAPA